MPRMDNHTSGKSKRLGNLFKVAAASVGLAVVAMPTYADTPSDPPLFDNIDAGMTYSSKTISNFLEANRTIRLTGRVEKESAVKVIDQLRLLSEMDPTAEITLIIHSNGGSVASGLAIYDAIQSIPNDVRTVCEGPVMSMGAFLLSVGTQGKREANPNCQIMYHQTSGGNTGKTADREISTAEAKRLYGQMLSILSQHTGWSEEDLEALMDHNLYLGAEEAKDMGFIDTIIEPVKALPSVSPRTDLPPGFCDADERRHIRLCN